jgi:hypothetical protein
VSLTCGRSCVANGVNVVIRSPAPHVDDAVDDGGGGFYIVSGRVVPELGPGGGVEGVGVVVKAPHVDDAVDDGGGGPHDAFGRVVSRAGPRWWR